MQYSISEYLISGKTKIFRGYEGKRKNRNSMQNTTVISKTESMKKPASGLATRIITGVLLAVFSFALIIWGIFPFTIEVLILGVVGVDEFYRMAEKKGIRPSRITGYFAVAAVIFFANWGSQDYLSTLLAGFVLISMLGFIGRKGFHVSSFLDVGVTVLGFLYVGWFFSFLVLIRKIAGNPFNVLNFSLDRGAGFVLLLVFATSFTDIGAFFVGKFLGKHKLAPHISPKKTVEGSIGGLLGALGGALLIGTLFRISTTDLIAIGLICGVFAQLGDLWASILKRDVNTKDSGSIFAGHGGVLDRFDSILFTAPLVYFYLQYFYR
jgi:phosphatidate cytidylyltransferase